MAPIANSDKNLNLFNEIQNILKVTGESASVEYKRSDTWDNLKYRIVKTALAMGNNRDGGIIIIGVSDDWVKTGISDEHIATFDDEKIKACISSFASSINITIVKHTEDEMDYLVIKVDEFIEYPFVCKRSHMEGKNKINAGDVYIRSKSGKPETRKINNEIEMRELIELAIEKGLDKRSEQFKKIIQILSGSAESKIINNEHLNEILKRKYDQESGDL